MNQYQVLYKGHWVEVNAINITDALAQVVGFQNNHFLVRRGDIAQEFTTKLVAVNFRPDRWYEFPHQSVSFYDWVLKQTDGLSWAVVDCIRGMFVMDKMPWKAIESNSQEDWEKALKGQKKAFKMVFKAVWNRYRDETRIS